MLGVAHMFGLVGYAKDEKWARELFQKAKSLGGDIDIDGYFDLMKKNDLDGLAMDEEQSIFLLLNEAGFGD